MVKVLDGKFRFHRSDGLNIILEKKVFKKGKVLLAQGKKFTPHWGYSFCGYFGRLEEVFEAIMDELSMGTAGNEDEIREMQSIKLNLVKMKRAVVDEVRRCVTEYERQQQERTEERKRRTEERRRKGRHKRSS